jgi:hypothetical protein
MGRVPEEKLGDEGVGAVFEDEAEGGSRAEFVANAPRACSPDGLRSMALNFITPPYVIAASASALIIRWILGPPRRLSIACRLASSLIRGG